MNGEIILAIIGTGLAVIVSNIALIAWIRSDMKLFEMEMRGWKQEVSKEMTDFHGRLCITEERNR